MNSIYGTVILSMLAMSTLCGEGDNISPQHEENEGFLEPAPQAQSPHKEAFDALNLGDIYFYGLFDHEKDLDKAEGYYKKAAKQQASPEVQAEAKQRLALVKKERKASKPKIVRSQSLPETK